MTVSSSLTDIGYSMPLTSNELAGRVFARGDFL